MGYRLPMTVNQFLTMYGDYKLKMINTLLVLQSTHIFGINNNKLEEIDLLLESTVIKQFIEIFDYNGYLYAVCDENASSLQIMDLSYLPDSVHLVYDVTH